MSAVCFQTEKRAAEHLPGGPLDGVAIASRQPGRTRRTTIPHERPGRNLIRGRLRRPRAGGRAREDDERDGGSGDRRARNRIDVDLPPAPALELAAVPGGACRSANSAVPPPAGCTLYMMFPAAALTYDDAL